MKHKLIMENWRRYLDESGEMPPRGHMPYPAGYSWPPEISTFHANVKMLYDSYKAADVDSITFRAELFRLWNDLESQLEIGTARRHGMSALLQLVDAAEEEAKREGKYEKEADNFDDIMLDIEEAWYSSK